MLTIEPGLYVCIQQLEDGPAPYPLRSGFNCDTAYRVLGLHTPSETAEAYLVLCNDRDEIWFISNKHVRCVAIQSQPASFRLPIRALQAAAVRGASSFADRHSALQIDQ